MAVRIDPNVRAILIIKWQSDVKNNFRFPGTGYELRKKPTT